MNIRHFLFASLASFAFIQGVAQPKVVTDPRFARGATMAFGRIKSATTNGGSAISKRGFCIAENPNPTINDSVNTATLSNNGTIYWFKNLKPATKYYMRAYATNKDGQTGYGEVIKFYTIPMGKVTYSLWRGEADDATYARIQKAMDESCFYFNNMTSAVRDYDVAYSPGTPTADCNYTDRPHMNVGAIQSYQRCGTIMHEMEHGLGLQNYSTQWSKDILRSGNGTGTWLGDRVTEALQFWDNNTTSVLNGDGIHMWPYGINGAQEDNGTDVLYLGNAMICQALGEDGLEHSYQCFAEPYYALQQEDTIKYYIKNESADRGRYTSYLIPTSTGILKWRTMSVEKAAQNDSAAWYITFTPENQYYQFRNVATGQFISYSAGLKTVKRTSINTNDNWRLMKGRVDVDGQRGYWVIRTTPATTWTPNCIQANPSGAVALKTFDISNAAEAQRWLIMTLPEAKANEQKAVANMKKDAQDLFAQLNAHLSVPHIEGQEGLDQTFANQLQSFEERTATATTPSEMLAVMSEAQQAENDFLGQVWATNSEQLFDLTGRIVNPTFENGTANGWSTSGAISYGCLEFYEKTFDFNQTVSNLPVGSFKFCAQGFQRPGSTAASADVAVNAVVYADSKTAKLAHIKDDAQSVKVGTGTEVTQNGLYVPNNMQAASAYFNKGLYENSVMVTTTNTKNSLKVGIRSTSMPSAYWVIFDNFRLYYQGNEIVTGIKPVGVPSNEQPTSIYTLDGRRLSPDAKLRSGLYIINGRKTVIR